ncbi:MAG: hypothetical protein L6W00_00155 [Lentisphaeria bacterium]|nr:MAG: hypothetical protein L6W00_00155 [Lentisphaeria bacterium]
MEIGDDNLPFLYLATTRSRDLIHFTPIRKLTEADRAKNYSSPGCVIEFNGEYHLCLQSYCRENGEKYGNANSRLYRMHSRDLVTWSRPELLRVKGDAIPDAQAGRMIDPFLLRCDDDSGPLFYCFFKQNGISRSVSRDLIHWNFLGSCDGGENVCIIRDGDEFLMVHSPANGIAFRRSRDLVTWRDCGCTFSAAPAGSGRAAGSPPDFSSISAPNRKSAKFCSSTTPPVPRMRRRFSTPTPASASPGATTCAAGSIRRNRRLRNTICNSPKYQRLNP